MIRKYFYLWHIKININDNTDDINIEKKQEKYLEFQYLILHMTIGILRI